MRFGRRWSNIGNLKLLRFSRNTLIYGEARRPGVWPNGALFERKRKLMKIHLNPILKVWIEVERESRRKWLPESKTEAIAQILSEWEAQGDAMRYVGKGGHICWRATPRFLDRLRDAELDAIEEFEAL